MKSQGIQQLKGIVAVVIALIHFYSWAVGEPADWAINLAQFGVGLFFIMSGYGLTLGYADKPFPLLKYWRRRFTRIVPLFLLATALTIAIRPVWGPEAIALNYSLAFGFIANSWHIAGGAWAVGCELVFYTLFALWGMIRFPRWYPWLLLILSMGMGLAMMSSHVSLEAQWVRWINPGVQACMFAAGILLAGYPIHTRVSRVGAVVFLAMALLMPTPSLVAHWRPLMMLCCCCVVQVCADGTVGGHLGRALTWLGNKSYEIYLLHPIAWLILAAHLRSFGMQL